jgi:YidC/Oxa1 family membrane protein insertase
MDRNSAIGLTLIAVLLLGYFYWVSTQQPEQPVVQPATTQQTTPTVDSLKKSTVIDSAFVQQLGNLGSFATGEKNITNLETEDIKVAFSNQGVIEELELKKYKTYSQKALKLVHPSSSQFKLLTKYEGKDIDLYSLYYQKEESKVGDTTLITFKAQLSNGGYIAHRYKVPNKGYEIFYALDIQNIDAQMANLSFQWSDIVRPMEKDLADTRNNTTITYYEAEDGFSSLSATGSAEKESIASPLKWVAIKQKFFLASIIGTNNFSSGELEYTMNAEDTSVVKRADVKLNIATTNGKADFKYYIGPNDYQVIGKVTDDFSKNVELGWRPIYWINKWVIFPVFNFLSTRIANYGVIIIILVLLLKLVLAPLSYRSFLSMAKMKVLKPELDEIKERVGDDMTKVQQEQMKLYQQVGVNPISGCIPVLLQMPLILAMFYLFPASIELRQQPFLWAEDLSTYDSIISFPFSIPFLGSHLSLFTLLMTIANLVFAWQNNQISSVTGPMKSMQYMMPVIFLFVLNTFSAGLTFYYFISTLFTFAQQAIIRRFVDDDKIKAILEENRKKVAAGGGSKSKFMNKLQEAMKAGEEARKRTEEEKRKRKK